MIDSIRNRMLLLVLGAALIPLIILFLAGRKVSFDALESAQYEKLQAVTEQVQRQIEVLMQNAERDLQSLKSNQFLVDPQMSLDQRIYEMERIVAADDDITDLTIYQADGIMIRSTSSGHQLEPMEKSHWLTESVTHNRISISQPHRVAGVPGLHLKIYIPVFSKNSEELTVIVARRSFSYATEIISGASRAIGGRTILLNPNGFILTSENDSELLEIFDKTLDRSLWKDAQFGIYTEPEGSECYFASQPIKPKVSRVGETWLVLSTIPEEVALAGVHTLDRYLIIIGLITLGTAIFIGASLAKKFSAPFANAAHTANLVRKGELYHQLPVTGTVESKLLAQSFNSMVSEVNRHQIKLETLVDERTEKLRNSRHCLANTTAQLRASYNATNEAILVIETDQTILAANQKFYEIFGIDRGEEEGWNINEIETEFLACFEPSCDFGSIWKEIQNSHAVLNSTLNLKSPKERYLHVFTSPVRNTNDQIIAQLWTFRDETEQRNLQRGLEQAQKMEAVGRLAGGIAHDFNNLLTAIIGNLDIAKQRKIDDIPKAHLAIAHKAAGRAAALVKQMLTFSRKSKLQLSETDLNTVVKDVRDLCTHSMSANITINLHLAEELWLVKADPYQIEQVVMNMCVNARDALGENGGEITLTTQDVSLTPEEAAPIPGACEGNFATLSISDNGSGMPKKVIEKIFEPFFTTKDPGKGTGLGLATSFNIIGQHKGWISCESTLGKGTTFTLFFPGLMNATRTEDGDSSQEAETPQEECARGNETILLVDDEPPVRAVAEGILKMNGYCVVIASNGQEAIDLYQKNPQQYDLVMLDLTMPVLSGKDTLIKLREHPRYVPVVICSGYLVDLDDFQTENDVRPDGTVQKPYSFDVMIRTIRDTLDDQNSIALPS